MIKGEAMSLVLETMRHLRPSFELRPSKQRDRMLLYEDDRPRGRIVCTPKQAEQGLVSAYQRHHQAGKPQTDVYRFRDLTPKELAERLNAMGVQGTGCERA